MRNTSELKRAIGAMNITHETRIRTVNMALDPSFDRKSICKTFGISEKTLRNWLDRFAVDGVDGLLHKEGADRQSDVPLDKIKRYCKKLCKRGKLTVKKFIRTIRRNDRRLYSGSHARRLIRSQIQAHGGKNKIRLCKQSGRICKVAKKEHL